MLVTQLLTVHAVFTGAVTLGGIIRVPVDAPTIQIAIEDSQPFDTIIVAPGTYFEAINFGGKVIVVQSENPTDALVVANTIINAGGLGNVVTFTGGEDQINTVLDGFTITGGAIGIDAHNSRAVIRRCVIRNNVSHGVFQADGIIEDCRILDNNSYGLNDCDGTVRRCLLQNNFGAGLYACDGTLSDSHVRNNRGGGVAGGNVDLVRCDISANSGAGVYFFDSNEYGQHTGDIDSCTIVGNGSTGITANGNDGGVVRNTVVAGNGSDGIYRSRKSVISSTITGNRRFGFEDHPGVIRHVILWDNQLGPLTGSTTPLFSGTSNPYFVRPGFWDNLRNVWVDGDYHLSQDSPFINAGDPAYATNPANPIEDIDGNPRIVGPRVDIGAFEFQAKCDGDDFDDDGTPDICDRDIDGDGIPNVTDRCDDTPLDIPVDADGRPTADLNHDCTVDLFDFGIFQESMIGP